MPFTGHTPYQHREFIESQPAIGVPLTPGGIFEIGMLAEILALLVDLKVQIGALAMATQADADALTQQIQSQKTAWLAWANNVEAILGNVEAALTAAEQANGISLDAAKAALADGQTAISALPVETDPTVTPPAPAPTPAPGS